jgi:hypothetical protein
MRKTMNTQHKCEQQCGATADCYAGGKRAGDWAGRYCYTCQQALGFVIFDDYNNTEGNTMEYEILESTNEDTGTTEYGVFNLSTGTVSEWCATQEEAELAILEKSTTSVTSTLVESVTEGAQWVANMMNSGRVNPKDVYPKGRYSGD